MNKKNLLISFSGGETSAYMTQWLWNHKQDEYNMLVVFANTGLENEETLNFVNRFSIDFKIPVLWVESVSRVSLFGKVVKMATEIFNLPWIGARLSSTYKLVNFLTASREGEPFEAVIQKYGIPNQNAPHCTRELKQYPIKSFADEYFGKGNYETAIGIRIDEVDRMNAKRKENKIIYPLIHSIPMTKPKINFWWSQQKFRLELKGYEGNCTTCWKKSDHKLYQIAKEAPYKFNFMGKMEARYEKYVPESRKKLIEQRGELVQELYPIRFFRKNRSTDDILRESKDYTGNVIDDSLKYDLHNESCEVFAECSDN